MTELCQKRIRAMDLRNLSKHTQRSYLTAVTGLAKRYLKSAEKIINTMIEDYLLHLKNEKKKAPATCCAALTGIRFFYAHVLDRKIFIGFSLNKKNRRLPPLHTWVQKLNAYFHLHCLVAGGAVSGSSWTPCKGAYLFLKRGDSFTY